MRRGGNPQGVIGRRSGWNQGKLAPILGDNHNDLKMGFYIRNVQIDFCLFNLLIFILYYYDISEGGEQDASKVDRSWMCDKAE